MIQSAKSAWYVVKTQPGKETVARVNLERQGIETFCPLYAKTFRKGSQFTERLAPLFSGYIFSFVSPVPGIWRSINASRGVAYVLGQAAASGMPTPVPDAVMDELRSACEGGRIIRAPEFQCGDRVVIDQGPMSGLAATILSLDQKGRVALLLDMMGGVSAQASADQLRAA